MEEEIKKKRTSKKKKNIEEQVVETPVSEEIEYTEIKEKNNNTISMNDELSSIIDDSINEVMEEVKEVVEEEIKKEVETHIASCFTTEEKLYIIKLIADGYRPFDIVKKARFKFKFSEEKMKRLSLNVRTVEQLIKAMEM